MIRRATLTTLFADGNPCIHVLEAIENSSREGNLPAVSIGFLAGIVLAAVLLLASLRIYRPLRPTSSGVKWFEEKVSQSSREVEQKDQELAAMTRDRDHF